MGKFIKKNGYLPIVHISYKTLVKFVPFYPV